MIPSSGSSCAVDKVGSLQKNHDLAEILFRNFLSSGDLLDLHRLVPLVVLNQVSHRQQTVITFGSDFHCDLNVYTVSGG